MIRRRPAPKPDHSFAGAARDRGAARLPTTLVRAHAGVSRDVPRPDGRFLLPGTVASDKLGGDVTDAGRAVLTAADAAAQRDALELGTAAEADDAAFAPSVHTHEVFPVDAVFTATVSTNPSTLLGYGTWSSLSTVPYYVWERTA